ncbi:MAG: hypothetical protein KKA44_03660 [Alphaproteobacteria bacterium]|nr:hypothetical protein [Alphaproteobacteria bacterium]MBU0863908.1 hypothetical protein [Alphaproteobacteria bacterium]MBU1824059.1 hypothetical protein [Alphaproteobacteria bacterium]
MQNRTPIAKEARPPLPDFTLVLRKYRHDGWTPERRATGSPRRQPLVSGVDGVTSLTTSARGPAPMRGKGPHAAGASAAGSAAAVAA